MTKLKDESSNKYAPIVEKLSLLNSSGDAIGLSESELRSEEQKLGVALPEDYRNFLRAYGGITFESVAYRIDEPLLDNLGVIDSFVRLPGQEHLDTIRYFTGIDWDRDPYPGFRAVRQYTGAADWTTWPRELLPIGSDYQLNVICLCRGGLRPGAVVLVLSQYIMADNFYVIADSFDEFMQRLNVVPED